MGGGGAAAPNFGAKLDRGTLPPSQNLCPDGSVGCQEPAPTMVIVIAGLCVMLFLIAIALLLLFYSYYKYRRPARVGLDVESAAALAAMDAAAGEDEGSENYDGAFLVLMPGDEEPHFFARPSPLPGDLEDPEGVTGEILAGILDAVLDREAEIAGNADGSSGGDGSVDQGENGKDLRGGGEEDDPSRRHR
ncbi:uncharacterized protein LOC9650491 [Selaginella moellendorffii]|nr:uncharacterized protein LOC9650491 [Selaginella moellendorffii]|eukprot:XP_002989305.2 uncharacterized protein LOC9650491 [Selaginella moellendorffii]